jgi:hypothetical protein
MYSTGYAMQHRIVNKTPNERRCEIAEKCSTREPPLCPLQKDSLENGIWYADEAICPAEKYQKLRWIKKQKEIARLKLGTDAGFFTMEMLKILRTVTGSTAGADPDDPAAEKNWLKEHSTHHKNKPDKSLKLAAPVIKANKPAAKPLQGSFNGF